MWGETADPLRKDHASDLSVCSGEGCGAPALWVDVCPDCGELVAGCAVHYAAITYEVAGSLSKPKRSRSRLA
jgi:hypothetical protein